MFYQNSKTINVFARYGCYFFSLGKIAEKVTGKELTKEDIWETYVMAVGEGWMKVDCYIVSPQKVLMFFLMLLDEASGWKAKYIGWWNKDTGEEFWDGSVYNFEVLRYNYGSFNHFKLDDYEPHHGEFATENQGLTGRRFFYVYKEG